MNTNTSLIQRLLGEDWAALPAVIQRHYQINEPGQAIVVTGKMTIDYPHRLMPVLKLLRLLGALVDLKGEHMTVQVKKWRHTDPSILYWQRHIQAATGKRCLFASRMVWQQDHELIELVGMGFGIRLKLSVEQGKLIYRSHGHLLKIGPLTISIPDTLLLGHAVITEQALSEDSFLLDFQIVHPIWGKTYYYGGVFNVPKI
ncbi:MAG: DUF4166 domain-containing protein [Methylobacter sp.]